jgi:hypothetical protein
VGLKSFSKVSGLFEKGGSLVDDLSARGPIVSFFAAAPG